MPDVELTCSNCSATFSRSLCEYRRSNERLGRQFCSQSCRTSYSNRHLRDHDKLGNRGNLQANNRKDSLSPFRWFLARCRYRRTKWDCDLSLQTLVDLWQQQKGICPFTNWALTLPVNSTGFVAKSMRNASLDRVNSAIGYMQSNVRLVALPINLPKKSFNDKELLKLLADNRCA